MHRLSIARRRPHRVPRRSLDGRATAPVSPPPERLFHVTGGAPSVARQRRGTGGAAAGFPDGGAVRITTMPRAQKPIGDFVYAAPVADKPVRCKKSLRCIRPPQILGMSFEAEQTPPG